MSDRYNRKYRLIFGVPYKLGRTPYEFDRSRFGNYSPISNFIDVPNAYILTNHHIEFTINKDNTKNPNSSEITLTNIPEELVMYLEQYKSQQLAVRFEAGYEDNLIEIFKGTIDNVEDDFKDVTRKTKLTLGDATVNTTESFSQRSYPRNSSVDQVVRDLVSDMGLGVGYIENTNRVLKLSKSYHGQPYRLLDKIARDNNMSFSIQNNNVYMVSVDKKLPTTSAILSRETGLIGTPEVISKKDGVSQKDNKTPTDGLRVTCLLDGNILPESTIYVDSGRFTGAYKVIKMTQQGSYEGTEWYNIMECVKIDATLQNQ